MAIAAEVQAPQQPEVAPATGGTAAPAARRQPLPSAAMVAAWILASLSILAGWFVLYAFTLSGFQEHSAQRALYAAFRSELAQAIAPVGGRVTPGVPVAVLRIPQAGVNDVVLEGTTAGILEQGPGLEADTPLPGQAGVSVIYGRQTMFGGPFRHLSALQPGDVMQVTTGQGNFNFRVLDVRYPGDPYPPPPAPGTGRIVLVTTTGSGWRVAGSPNEYLYVDASLIGKTVASSAGMPTAIPSSQQPMHGDNSVLMPLVLWLQLFLLLALALAWVRSRWGGWQTWLIGAPILFAVLWIISEVSFQLLPNLV